MGRSFLNKSTRYAPIDGSKTPSLVVFNTPWHVCVHGLGLGEPLPGRTPPQRRDIKALLQISQLLLRRAPSDCFLWVVNELLETVSIQLISNGRSCRRSSAQFFKRTLAQIDRIDNLEIRAKATALLLQFCAQNSSGFILDRSWPPTLQQLLAALIISSPITERGRYLLLVATLQLLNAVRIACANEVNPPLQLLLGRYAVKTLDAIRCLSQPFYRKRLLALLLKVCGGWVNAEMIMPPAMRWSSKDYLNMDWAMEMECLLVECSRGNDQLPADDDIHQGMDFWIFPLSLALSAVAQDSAVVNKEIRDQAVVRAFWLLNRLTPASRASQFAFLVEALMSLEAMPVQLLQQHQLATMHDYLNNSGVDDQDAYLRCTYIAFTAQRVGNRALLPDGVYARINQALLHTPRPQHGYFSLPMVAAYTLYLHALDNDCGCMSPTCIGQLLDRLLPNNAVPHADACKLSYALLHLALLWHQAAISSSQ